jgi:dihydroneopterin aldolase
MDTIFVDAIEFYAYHGASDEEQSVGHRYSVDVELGYDTRRAGETDRLHDTISYSAVAKSVVRIGTEMQYRLVERLAARMAERLLEEFPAAWVRLRVKKLRPPMNVIAESAGVQIERTRS